MVSVLKISCSFCQKESSHCVIWFSVFVRTNSSFMKRKRKKTLHASHIVWFTCKHTWAFCKWWCFICTSSWNTGIFNPNVTICVKTWWIRLSHTAKSSLNISKINASIFFFSQDHYAASSEQRTQSVFKYFI